MGKTSAATQDYEAFARKLEELLAAAEEECDSCTSPSLSICEHYSSRVALEDYGFARNEYGSWPLVPYVVASLRALALIESGGILKQWGPELPERKAVAAALALARPLGEERVCEHE